MAKPSSPSHCSPLLSDTEVSSQGIPPKLPQSLEDQGLELGIVLSIQPLSSHPPPSDSRSSQESNLNSSDNPIQARKTIESD